MSIHPSFGSSSKLKQARSVLKRIERIKYLKDKKMWKEGDSVFGLPKIKTIRIKVKKEKPKEAPSEAPSQEQSVEEKAST